MAGKNANTPSVEKSTMTPTTPTTTTWEGLQSWNNLEVKAGEVGVSWLVGAAVTNGRVGLRARVGLRERVGPPTHAPQHTRESDECLKDRHTLATATCQCPCQGLARPSPRTHQKVEPVPPRLEVAAHTQSHPLHELRRWGAEEEGCGGESDGIQESGGVTRIQRR